MKLKKEWFFCVAIGGAPLKSADDWLKYMEQQMRGDQSQAEVSMKISAPTWERELEISTDVKGKNEALTFINSPAKEKGIGTLRLNNNMWNYFPKLKRKVTVSPSMLLGSWMGSDFTNDDLLKASSMSEDYNHVFKPDEKLSGVSYKVIENTAKSDAKVIWPKIVTLADKKDCLPRYHRYYDKKGELIRTLALSNVQKFDGHNVPTKWEMTPLKEKGRKTIMTYKKINFKVNFPSNHFTIQNLTDK
ncbi:MAG: outer membrane lipoprotein-sorting protein [Bacteriovoracaceae bacterium]|nr:outer membrane lipoprotein-sorting protein [Bacteriovoracaceae bacterium]